MIDVTGMTYEEAKKALNKIDPGIKDGGTQASEKYDAGEIIFQSERQRRYDQEKYNHCRCDE